MRIVQAGVLAVCVIVLSFAALGAPSSDVATLKVTAHAIKTSVTLGEVFEVTLVAFGPHGVTWQFPKEAGNESVELRTRQVTGLSASLPAQSHVYEARVFAISNAEIPSVIVQYRLSDGTEGTTESSPIALEIRSLLPKETNEQKLSDIRGPLSIGLGRPFWIMVGIVLISISALIIWVWRRRHPKTAPLAPVEIAPDTEALQALDALMASDLGREGYRPFYIQLIEIAKRYLERRLKWPILEMTSTETIAFLRDHHAARDLVSAMRDLAGAADQVKFARQQAQQEEAERHSRTVREMIGNLERRLAPTSIA